LNIEEVKGSPPSRRPWICIVHTAPEPSAITRSGMTL
jgi:hypothetical protein